MLFPDLGIISNVKISQYIPTFRTESLSGKIQTKERGIHRLEGSFDLTLMEIELREFESFLLMIRNGGIAFDLWLGGRFINNKVGTNPVVHTHFAAGSNGGNISGGAGTINKGDYFRIALDPKIYMSLTTIKLPQAQAALECYPPIVKRYEANTTLEFISSITPDKSVPIRAILNEVSQTVNYGESGLINTITINFKESTYGN